MEAMKMETRLTAPRAGRISLLVETGATVRIGAEMATIR